MIQDQISRAIASALIMAKLTTFNKATYRPSGEPERRGFEAYTNDLRLDAYREKLIPGHYQRKSSIC